MQVLLTQGRRGFLCSQAFPYMESLLSTQSANQLLRHKGQNTPRNSDNTLTLSELNFTGNNHIYSHKSKWKSLYRCISKTGQALISHTFIRDVTSQSTNIPVCVNRGCQTSTDRPAAGLMFFSSKIIHPSLHTALGYVTDIYPPTEKHSMIKLRWDNTKKLFIIVF